MPSTRTRTEKTNFEELNALMQKYAQDLNSMQLSELLDECDSDQVRLQKHACFEWAAQEVRSAPSFSSV